MVQPAVLHADANNLDNDLTNHVAPYSTSNHTTTSSVAPSSNHSKDADIDSSSRTRHRSSTNSDEVCLSLKC